MACVVQFLGAADAVLWTGEQGNLQSNPLLLNVQPLKPTGATEQDFEGDATPIIGEFRLEVRKDGGVGELHSLYTAVIACLKVKVADWTLDIAKGRGIDSYRSLPSGKLSAVVVLIPKTGIWSDGVNSGIGAA